VEYGLGAARAPAGKSIAGAFDKLGKTLKEGQPESSAARTRTARPGGATWSTPEKNVARETVTRADHGSASYESAAGIQPGRVTRS
jgi:hypothetical protein